jgi:uncharacterized membrane protein YqjE
MLESLRSSLALLLDAGATRIELAATEFEEERLRLIGLLFSTLATLMLLGITVMLLATFVIVLLWDSHRLLAIGAITVASALATLVSAKRWHERLVNRPAFMAATVAELQRDADLLRPQSANE